MTTLAFVEDELAREGAVASGRFGMGGHGRQGCQAAAVHDGGPAARLSPTADCRYHGAIDSRR